MSESLSLFQIAALIVLGPLTLLGWVGTLRSRSFVGMFLSSAMTLGIILLVDPEWATTLAKHVGIGRGADLLGYLTSLGLVVLSALSYSAHRRQRIQLTELVRVLALQDWERSRRKS
jgi:hypothetical protein